MARKNVKLSTRFLRETHTHGLDIYAKVYTIFYQKATNLFDRHSIWLWYIDIIYLQIVVCCQHKETDKGQEQLTLVIAKANWSGK